MEKEIITVKETEEEVARLKRLARKTHNAKLRQRYDIIRLILCKRPKREIAAILDISLTQVYLILNLYEEAGIEGLGLKRSTGRHRKLTDEQEKELCSIITEKLPKEVGLEPHCNWTAPLACKYVKDHYGVIFSERGMRDVFYRLKLSYTRPTYVLAKADPQKQAEFLEKLEGIKKELLNGKIDHLLYEDESMIRDYQAIQKSWFLKGQQRVIQTYGKHEGVKLLGILDYETGKVYVEDHVSYDAQVFLSFLKNVLKKYPTGNIVMILDNAKIHHAKLLTGFLQENPRLHLQFLPPYSPNLNIIEELWGWLKSTVINNVFFHTRDEIKAAVQSFLDYIATIPFVVIDRLCI